LRSHGNNNTAKSDTILQKMISMALIVRENGNAEECFFPVDTHMTLKGNEILAEALAAAISQTVPPRKETP
jgi:hypothetical protein